MSIDWGDAPTWVAAVFAGGAAWFAGWTWTSQRKQLGLLQEQVEEQSSFIAEQRQFMSEQAENLQLERIQLRSVNDVQRRKQAKTIRVDAVHTWAGGGRDPEAEFWEVIIRNGGTEPVYDLTVIYEGQSLNQSVRPYGGVAAEPGTPPIRVLPAGEALRFKTDHHDRGTIGDAFPTAYFTDAQGVRWGIDRHGKLAEETPQL